MGEMRVLEVNFFGLSTGTCKCPACTSKYIVGTADIVHRHDKSLLRVHISVSVSFVSL